MAKTTDLRVPARRPTTQFGRALREARGQRTQAELGNLVGRPQASISTWESGHVVPGLEMIERLEVALELARGELLVRGGYVDLAHVS
jgi:hypothetical protein